MTVQQSDVLEAPVTGLRIVHYQHPERPLYEAWCGAPVLGIDADRRPVTCPLCAELKRKRRESR